MENKRIMQIGTSLFKEKDCELVDQLIRNIHLFIRAQSDMLEKDIIVVGNRLVVNSSIRLVSQRKKKVDEEKRSAIEEVEHKLTTVGFITETQYLT